MKRAGFLTVLAFIAFTAPATAAEPICHGQFAPKTEAEQEQAQIEEYMRYRAEFGFRADEAYVRELIRRGVWEYDVGYIPVTPEENDYLRFRDKLRLSAEAERYLRSRPDLSGGWSIKDDWPRGPYVLVHLTRDRLSHEYNLKKLVRYPDNLRTDDVRYSERQLDELQNRIDWEELAREGIDLVGTGIDIDTNSVTVDAVTKRADAAAYLRSRYGPVTVNVIATEPTYLACEEATYFEVSRTGRSLTVHWTRSGSVESERIDVIEHADRVEIGVVDRVPHGAITADAVPDKLRVRLARPLGERAVIDMANRKRLIQYGPNPGEPRCPSSGRDVDQAIESRKIEGLPHGRAHVRRLVRSGRNYTKAESRYLTLYFALEFQGSRVSRYSRRFGNEIVGSEVRGRFPGKPHLVVAVTRRPAFHARKLRRLVKHPELLRVIRSRATAKQLSAAGRKISRDARAGDGFIDGYGAAGFFVDFNYEGAGEVVVRVFTRRTDAARYFRRHYGPVRVEKMGRRYECRNLDF